MGARSVFGSALGMGKLAMVAAAAIGLSAFLGGCSKSSKSQVDACMQENTELRQKNAELEQSLREKDMQLSSRTGPGVDAPGGAPTAAWSGTSAPVSSTGSSGPSAADDFVADSSGGVTATLSGEVLFDSGSATLKSTSKKSLDRIANTLKSKYSGRQVRVAGHTDSDPIKRSKWGSNDALSQARADSVRKYLVGKGVPAGKIDAVGYGATRPKGSKAASRRVEIQVLR